VYPYATVVRATRLRAQGHSIRRVAREVGVARSTIRAWCTDTSRHVRSRKSKPLEARALLPLGAEADYAYLLGIYLGDGHVAHMPRSYVLRLALDARYPEIIEATCAAAGSVMPENRVGVYLRRPPTAVTVTVYSKHWPVLQAFG
jgi:hypothetical protein